MGTVKLNRGCQISESEVPEIKQQSRTGFLTVEILQLRELKVSNFRKVKFRDKTAVQDRFPDCRGSTVK